MRRLTVILIAGLAVAFFGAPSSSQAIPFGTDDVFAKAVRSCDKNLQKEGQKLKADLEKRFGKCTDQALLEAFKDAKNIKGGNPDKTDYAKRAQKCEDQLAVGIGKLAGMNTKVAAAVGGDCAVTDASGQTALAAAGHLAGASAPSGSSSWAQANLSTTMTADALQFLTTTSPQRWDVFDELITRSELDASPSGATAVNCESSPGSHPLLCTLHVDRSGSANVGLGPPVPRKGAWASMCNYHECEVDDTVSEANVRLATAAGGVDLVQLPLQGSTIYEFCKIDDVPFIPSLGGNDIRVVRSANSRSLKPAVLDADTVVCIETRGGEGWCDCAGAGVANDYSICTDHISSNGNDCPVLAGSKTATDTEEQCFCTSSPNPCGGLLEPACAPTTSCKANFDCAGGERCGSTQAGARCHPGTVQHAETILSGSSVTGDCYIASTTQLTVTPRSGDSGGICASGDGTNPVVGPDTCNPAGGDGCSDCRAKIGPDGVPCTADDLLPRTAPAVIPITTGVANSSTRNAILSGGVGACTGGANEPCIEDRNCYGRCSVTTSTFCEDSAGCPATEVCNGSSGTCGGVTLINVVTPSLSGVPFGSCAGIESSDLANWEYVNSFSFADAATLADGTNRSRFICK